MLLDPHSPEELALHTVGGAKCRCGLLRDAVIAGIRSGKIIARVPSSLHADIKELHAAFVQRKLSGKGAKRGAQRTALESAMLRVTSMASERIYLRGLSTVRIFDDCGDFRAPTVVRKEATYFERSGSRSYPRIEIKVELTIGMRHYLRVVRSGLGRGVYDAKARTWFVLAIRGDRVWAVRDGRGYNPVLCTGTLAGHQFIEDGAK